MYLPACLSLCLSISSFVCLLINFCLSICLISYLSFICLSAYCVLCLYLCLLCVIYLSRCLSTYRSVCLPISLSNLSSNLSAVTNLYILHVQVDVFFGPVCDFAVAPVARQTRFWNVPVVSVGAMALDFASSRLKMYPLLTRVGPVHFGHLSRFFATLSRRYQWRKIKLLYSKEGQDYLIKSFCHLAAEALIYTWDDIEPDLDKDYFKMHARQTREEARSVLVDEVGLKYGGRDS